MSAATAGATAEMYRQKAHAYYRLSLDVSQCERKLGLLHLAARWQHLADTVERGRGQRTAAGAGSPSVREHTASLI